MAHDYDKRGKRTKDGIVVTAFPDLNAPEEDILAFSERHFNDDSVFRNRRLERATKGMFYVAGRQWSELDTDVILDGVRGYVLRDIISSASPEAELPRPVTNFIGLSVEVELANQDKRELIPKIYTDSRDPLVNLAANHAKEILEYRNKVENWPEIRELSTFINIVTGTAAIMSWWDEKSTEVSAMGSPYAAQCPGCGAKLASNRVPRAALERFPIKGSETIAALTGSDPQSPEVLLTHCPSCGGADPLRGYDVSDPRDGGIVDMFGRRLGMLFPKGNTAMRVITPWEMYPQNAGVNCYPHNFRMMGTCTIEELDWVFERYPDLEGAIEPEEPSELMKYHPILGEWQVSGHFDSDKDSGIFENHVRVYHMLQEKGYRHPDGACFVDIGHQAVAYRGPLYHHIDYEDDQGRPQPVCATKTMVAVARHKIQIGEFYGRSLPDDCISPQNRINGLDGQVIGVRERWGSPHVSIPEDMYLTGPEWISQYGSGMILRWKPSALKPDAEPKPWGGQINPAGFHAERDRMKEDLKELAGPPQIEIGEAPKNITTTSGLQLLGEAAERRRGPRERSNISMFQKVWRHRLDMLWAFRVEDDEYETKVGDNVYEVRAFNRTLIAGQTNVIIEKQGYVDKSLYQREATREAQADGLYDTTSQAAKKRILELRGLPTDVNEGENLQVDLANQQWIDYTEGGIEPIVDESIDNFKTRYQVLGTRLMSPEGCQLEKKFQWNLVKRAIAGWEKKLIRAEATDDMIVEHYQGNTDANSPAVKKQYAAEMVAYDQAMQAYEQAKAAPPPPGVVPPPLTPPQEPPPPIFLPRLKQDRIKKLWDEMLDEAIAKGQFPEQLLALPGFSEYKALRACVDAYRLLDRAQTLGAAVGVPPVAPPGQGTATAPVVAGVDVPRAPNPPNPMNPPNPANPGAGDGRGTGV